MRRHVQASSVRSNLGGGNGRGHFGGFAATPALSSRANGSSAPFSPRSILAVLALAIAAFAIIAAPASAAPETSQVIVSNPSYSTAHVEVEEVTANGFFANYTFEVSTDGSNWEPNTSGFNFGNFTSISTDLTGLKGGTHYFVRVHVVAGGDAFSPAPYPDFTTLAVAPPEVVSVANAGEVEYTQAQASGVAHRPTGNTNAAFNLTCRFQYVTDAQFSAEGFANPEATPCTPDPVEAEGDSPVSATLSNLAPGTTYHLRLFLENAGGTDSEEAASTFTTQSPIPGPTVIATDDASEVGFTTATLSGEIERPSGNDPALNVECRFEYVTDAQFTAEGFNAAQPAFCDAGPVTTPGAQSVEAHVGGLQNGTTYHFRLVGSNQGGSDSEEAANTFTTQSTAAPTVVSIDNASEVGFTTATLTGKVNRPAGTDPSLNVECRFEYITDAGFQARNEEQSMTVKASGGTYLLSFKGETSAPIAFNATAGDLQAALEALPAIGAGNVTVSGGPGSPSGNVPYQITFAGALAAKDVEQLGSDSSALLQPGESFVSVSTIVEGHAEGFDGAQTAFCEPLSTIEAEGDADVEAHLNGLKNATTYHVRLVAQNQGGTDAKVAATFTTQTTAAPTVTIDPPSAVTGTSAHFSGTINPNGTDASFAGLWQFLCTPDCGTEPRGFPPGTSPAAVETDATLAPNTAYQVKLVATNQGGVTAESSSINFTSAKVVPGIQPHFAEEVKASTVKLVSAVNPHNSVISYQFEWGTGAGYGNTAAASPASLPADNELHEVTASLGGLAANTTYHFRLAATNTETGETTHGDDRTFTTETASGPAACANEQLRAENNSLSLPDCRAYELVSPVKKSGYEAGAPNAEPKYALATADGSGIVYGTRGPQGVTRRGYEDYAVGFRGPNGWSSEAALGEEGQNRIYALGQQIFNFQPAADLRSFVFFTLDSRVKDNPSLLQRSGALYKSNLGGGIEWLTRPQIPNPKPAPGSILQPGWQEPLGGSPDLSTVYFWSGPTLLPEDAARTPNVDVVEEFSHEDIGAWGLYEYSEGVLKPAGTLPDGSQDPFGAAPAASGNTFRIQLDLNTPDTFGNEVSRDGSTLFFVSPDPAAQSGSMTQLYVRREGHSTLVSHLPDGTPSPSGVIAIGRRGQGINEGVANLFAYASPDGNKAIFQSKSALTLDAPGDSALKYYLYDVKTDTVSYLPGLNNNDSEQFPLAASDDGSRFFVGSYMVENGVVKKILPGGTMRIPARTTASGSVIVFSSDNIPGFNTGGFFQVFRYDVSQDQLSCVSCPPDTVVPDGGTIGDGSTISNQGNGHVKNRPLSADGNRVFFDTRDPLVPEDTGGYIGPDEQFHPTRDVYEWTPSGVHLITSGKANKDAFYLDSSADGRDVFFATTENLDPRDTDGIYDVYDARVGGGYSQAASITPCSGNDSCKGASGSAPSQASPATSKFSAPAGSKPSAKVKVSSSRVVGGKLALKLAVPGPGSLTASGKGLKKVQRSFKKAGSYQLKVPLKPGAKAKLKSKGKLKLKVRLRFTPKGAKPATANVVLTVKG